MAVIGSIILESTPDIIHPVEIEKDHFNGKAVGVGILQTANEKNRNGRFYAREELFPQLVMIKIELQ